MEHLIQFTYAVDDDSIQKQLEAMAVRDLIKRFDEAVLKAARRQRGYIRSCDTFEEALIDYMNQSVNDFVMAHSTEIINVAGKMLADKLARTKRGKELLEGGN